MDGPLRLEAFSVFYWPVKSKLIQMFFERENKDFQIKSGYFFPLLCKITILTFFTLRWKVDDSGSAHFFWER